jgi:hypothetical protein
MSCDVGSKTWLVGSLQGVNGSGLVHVTMGFRSCRAMALNCAGLHTKHINNFACLQLVVYYIVIDAHWTR